MRLYREARKARKCLASRLGDQSCARDYGRCHSVSRRAALEPISEGGHVVGLNLSFDAALRNEGAPHVSPIGVHRASTFYGLCAAHDDQLFKQIDLPGAAIDSEGALLYLYRALCHEMYKKEWSIETSRLLQAELGFHGDHAALALGSAWAVMSLMEFLERCESSLVSHDYSQVGYAAFVSESAPYLVASSVWFPDRDFHGRQLQQLPQVDHVPGCIAAFALPHQGKSLVLLVWHRDTQWCTDLMLHSLATAFAPEAMGAALVRMIMCTSENVFFRPSWWAGRSESDRRLYQSFWRESANLHNPVSPTYLRAIDGFELEFEVAYVEQLPTRAAKGSR